MGGDGKGDEERLGERGLVDLAGEEEVRFGGGNGAGDEGDDGGVGQVNRGEDGEGVSGVALDARYWLVLVVGGGEEEEGVGVR